MEKDGVTRLYYYHDLYLSYVVKEAWPKPAGFDDDAWTHGQDAEDTYKRADFICVSVHTCKQRGFWIWKKVVEQRYWSVHIPGKGPNAWFKIDQVGYFEDDYANLAKKLEQHSGKTGLTILVG